ncbi:MAG: glutamate--tRNA ligase [Mycoplasmoidaceae bacterium]|nr:MAG: glutamate--tRNA ligase [Mycoplasmoidaceae bacterium]
MKIRTRYAPSPTGFFHIGGARTALFNYLYAKHYNGEFIVRIEDTDQERHVEAGIDSQLDGLAWLGVIPDESLKNPGKYGPYRQTEKLDIFKDIADKLLAKGLAYYCFCTKEELDAERQREMDIGGTPKYSRKCLSLTKEELANKLTSKVPAVIRLKMQDNRVYEWNDLIRGKMSVPSSALTDPVIMKSNGIPMYNFAVTIDDCYMKITHVLRGEEHLSNTPYQIAIKEAIDSLKLTKYKNDTIQYGHLSIIVNEDGKKLSKRDTSVKQFIEDYKNQGYFPHAITNFISLLSWSPKDNQEIKTLKEIITMFDGTRLSSSPAFFDKKKMEWLSNEYFKKINDDEYLKFVNPFIKIDLKNLKNTRLAILSFKSQIFCAEQLNSLLIENYLSYDQSKIDDILNINSITKDTFIKCIKELANIINEIEINETNGNDIVNLVKEHTGLKGKELYMPIRLITIGKEHGPEMTKILPIIGKETIIKNINKYLK